MRNPTDAAAVSGYCAPRSDTCPRCVHPASTRRPVQIQRDERLVFDVGAHKGEDSDFYLKLGYRVVGVEANPELVDQLAARFKQQIEQGSYVIVPCAISASDEPLTFYVNEKATIWGTTDPTWAARNEA